MNDYVATFQTDIIMNHYYLYLRRYIMLNEEMLIEIFIILKYETNIYAADHRY